MKSEIEPPYERLQQDGDRSGSGLVQVDDKLRRLADGSFADPQMETNFKASFFCSNFWFHNVAICSLFWPALVNLMKGYWENLGGEWNSPDIPSTSAFAALPVLLLGRLYLHVSVTPARAQQIGVWIYVGYVVLLYVPDIVVLLAGTHDPDILLLSLDDTELSTAVTISSTVIGLYQGSHAPSLALNVSVCLTIVVDFVLNTMVIFRMPGRAHDVLIIATWLVAIMLGVCVMHVHERVIRTNYVNEEMRLRAQEQLASYLFHELRNHQNVQSATLELVAEHTEKAPNEPLCAEDISLVAEARVHSCQAVRIISNMLDYAKLQAGKFQPSMESFNLIEFLDECVVLVQHMARRKPNLLLEVRTDVGSSPMELLGPVQLLKQVVVNLLTNAIKYTSAGHVLLRATMAGPQIGPTPPIVIAVEDTGSGIPPNKLAAIFEPFEQGYQPGTGLGLPLCKAVIKMMDSELTVTQPSSGGSVFSFALNCSSAAPNTSPAAVVSSPASTSLRVPEAIVSSSGPPALALVPLRRAMLVLVADDQKANRMVLIRKLKQVAPFALIQEEADGEAALATLSKALNETPFDIAFLDEYYNADGLCGTEVTRRYRELEARQALASPKAHNLLVVGCSGSAGVDRYDETAFRAGQDLVLSKPTPTAAQMAKLLGDARPTMLMDGKEAVHNPTNSTSTSTEQSSHTRGLLEDRPEDAARARGEHRVLLGSDARLPR
jgi:signal transduction histidine kinase/CheY-like chemotaxis protein